MVITMTNPGIFIVFEEKHVDGDKWIWPFIEMTHLLGFIVYIWEILFKNVHNNAKKENKKIISFY